MALKPMAAGVGHLKMGALGFSGSGKTYTASRIAVGLRKLLGLKGPIAVFDTEAAFRYVKPWIEKETGMSLLGVESRAFADALTFIADCVKENVSVAVIDSASHIWKELTDSFLAQRNEARARSGKNPIMRLEFQDWAIIKAKWAQFADAFLTSPLHLIVCGRAGYEYEYQDRDDESGKKDLVKSGVKMKAEADFGYESSLLIEMKRVPLEENGKATAQFTHRCTVLKDRFGVLDSTMCDNPTFDFFKPYMECLAPGAHATVNLDSKTDMGVDDAGNDDWGREKRNRAIAYENLAQGLRAVWPGESADEKWCRWECVWKLLGTRSATDMENMSADRLKAAIMALPPVMEEVKTELKTKQDAEAKAEADAKLAKKAKPEKAETVKS